MLRVKQFVEEDLESFAERVQRLAYDAYPKHKIVQSMSDACVDALLKGCTEKRAAPSAMDHDPSSINDAIRLMKSARPAWGQQQGKTRVFLQLSDTTT